MLIPNRNQIALLISVCLVLFGAAFAGDEPIVWKPVTPEQLAMDKPIVEPDADAEAIFWEVRLDDKSRKKLYYEHYVRVKIFTERGRERFSKFDIPYTKGLEVENVAARVIKPDGSIVNVSPSDIFDRELYKSRRVKVRAKSFAVPGIEPGVIVEYQYREKFKGDSLNGEKLIFQRDIPIQKAIYYMRPYKDQSIDPTFFNMSSTSFRRDPNDESFWIASVTNMPAFKEEPYMAPKDAVRPWALLKYSFSGGSWSSFGIGFGLGFAALTKPDKLIKTTGAEITAGATNDTEKLKRIYSYVQKEIRNANFDRSGQPLPKIKFKKASDALKTKVATSGGIDMLFASLARAIGLQVHIVLSGDRSELFFNPNTYPVSGSFVHPAGIAVWVDGKRMFFNPGTPFLPFGKMIWYEENVHAMLAFDGAFRWSSIPLSGHEDTTVARTGKFELDADGTLTGTAERKYTGHWANDLRRSEFTETDQERIDHFTEEIKDKISTAEVSNVTIGNFYDPEKPLVKSYKLRIPNYGQKTGSRVFFQPGVFEFNYKHVFSSATREHPIYFEFPWSEFDEIEIKLPEGYKLEKFASPNNVKEKGNIAASEYGLSYDIETHTLKYKRDFFIGGDRQIYFKASAYEPLKKLFDLFHESDTYSLILRESAE